MKCSALTELALTNCVKTAADVRYLKALSGLTSLALKIDPVWDTPPVDADFASLFRVLPQLTDLHMCTPYEPFLDFNQALVELDRSGRLTTLHLEKVRFSNESLAALAPGCAHLSKLVVLDCFGWNAAGFAAVATHCLLLQDLTIRAPPQYSLRTTIEALATGAPLLERLRVSGYSNSLIEDIMADRPWLLADRKFATKTDAFL